MKVLMLSLDESLLNPDSQTSSRIKKYSSLVEKLEVVVYSSKKKSYKLSDYITVYSTGTKFKPFYPWQAFRIAKKIAKNHGIDLVTTQDPFETAMVGWWLKKKFKIGFNIQIHGDFFSTNYWRRQNVKNKARYKMAEKFLTKADSIRAVSKRIADSLKPLNVDPAKVVVAPIYVDWQNFQDKSDEGGLDLEYQFQNKFVILSVCRIAKEKNLDLLIEGFDILAKKYADLALVIVGAGPEEDRLKKKVNNLNIGERVFFTGWQNDLVGFYNAADIMIISSDTEGYNRTVLEAMACGTPVVMTDVGLAGDIVNNGINGLVYNVGDKEQLVASAEKLIEDIELRNKFITEGFKTIQQLPSEQKLLEYLLISWELAVKDKELGGGAQ